MRERQIEIEDWLAADAAGLSPSLPPSELPPASSGSLMVHLRRVEPTQRMARFYGLATTKSLFGETLLLTTWGRIGSKGRIRSEAFESENEAADAGRRVAKRKLRKGYRIA